MLIISLSKTISSPSSHEVSASAGNRGYERIAVSAVAAMLGSILLLSTGFASLPAVHDAMHDIRHSTGFPCH